MEATSTTEAPPRKPQAMRATTAERLQAAAELLANRCGERQYRLATRLMEQFGISRRAANDYLARARDTLAAEARDSIRDLGAGLPAMYRDALDRAITSGNLRTLERLLAGVRELVSVAKKSGELSESTGPTRVVFEVVYPDGNRREPYGPCAPHGAPDADENGENANENRGGQRDTYPPPGGVTP